MIFEQLEQRSMLTITSMTVDGVQSDNSIQEPAGKDLMVPIDATDDSGDAISYAITSSNPDVTVTPVTGDTYLTLNVNGTSSTGTAYSGTLTFKLFDSLAPNTVSTIETQITAGLWNNTTFARILNSLSSLMIAQGNFTSTGGNNGDGNQYDDEINSQLTFDNQGVIAWANAGPNTNDLEYFVTGVDEPGTTTPLTQSDLSANQQSLDYRYTIFGQLVDGLSTFNTMMNSTLVPNPNDVEGGVEQTSLPSPLINVTSASIVTNTQDTVLEVSAPTSAAGETSTISIVGTEANGATAEQAFTVNVVGNTIIDPPFLGTISSTGIVSATENTPLTITLPTTNPDGATLEYQIVDPTTGAAPANVTIGAINPTTGQVTLTPAAGFTGSISLLAEVAGTNSANTSPDTEPFTLTVNAAVTPNPPTDLIATALATNEIGLTWTAPTSNITGYDVYRGTTSGGESSTPLNSTPLSATATSYDDLTAAAGTQYFYTVQAIDSTAASSPSLEANTTTPSSGLAAPTVPTNLTASVASATELDLSWTAGSGGGTVTGYNVYRGTTPGGESTTPLNSTPLSPSTTTYQDTTVTTGTTYYYVVQAVDSTVASPSSNEATATPSNTLSLTAPTNLTASAVSATEIDLSWTAAASSAVTGYNVFRGTTAGDESITPLNSTPLSSGTTTFQDTTVTAGTTYYYVVEAIDNGVTTNTSGELNSNEARPRCPPARRAPPRRRRH